MIEIRHLNKTYRTAEKDIVALEDINLTIRDGEIFGIIGLSGAGKSTLVRCINLLEQPSAGEVIVDGESITALPRKELLKLRRSIGMIFQGFNLLEQRSVLRNVCFPLEIAGVKKKEAPVSSGGTRLMHVPTEIDLRGMESIEAVLAAERYLDSAVMAKLKTVTIIHGKGTGALRDAVRQMLKKNKLVKSYRQGLYGEGEARRKWAKQRKHENLLTSGLKFDKVADGKFGWFVYVLY